MPSSKRHMTAVVDSKEHGLYISVSPSSAARKDCQQTLRK